MPWITYWEHRSNRMINWWRKRIEKGDKCYTFIQGVGEVSHVIVHQMMSSLFESSVLSNHLASLISVLPVSLSKVIWFSCHPETRIVCCSMKRAVTWYYNTYTSKSKQAGFEIWWGGVCKFWKLMSLNSMLWILRFTVSLSRCRPLVQLKSLVTLVATRTHHFW